MFATAHDQLHARSKSFTGAGSSREGPGGDDGPGSPGAGSAYSRRHLSAAAAQHRRGTKVVGDMEGARLLHGQAGGPYRSEAHQGSVVSNVAVAASPPGSLGSEVPSRVTGSDGRVTVGMEGQQPPATGLRASDFTSRPATAVSGSSARLSQHSILQV